MGNDFAEGYAFGQGNASGGMGMGGDWFAILLLFALFNNGGLGGGAGGGIGAEVQRGFDTAGINSKLNGIENGLCDGFYAQNTNTLQGFAGVQNALCQGFSGVNSTVNAVGYGVQSGFADLSRQVSECCCQTQRAIDGVNYNIATQACDTRKAIEDGTNRIIGFLTTQQIDTLRAENAALTAQLSNNAQTERIISRLAPNPIPAYPACPTNGAYGWQGWGGGCGCG